MRSFWLSTFIMFFMFASNGMAQEMLCNTSLRTSDDATRLDTICVEQGLGCDYMLSVGSIFSPVSLGWYSDGTACGGYRYGRLRVEALNLSEGKLNITILEKVGDEEFVSKNEKRAELYSGTLTKRLTNDLIIWEGQAKSSENSSLQPMYLRKSRRIPNTDSQEKKVFEFRIGKRDAAILSETSLDDVQQKIYDGDEFHGAYYCGDGGCEPEGIGVIVKTAEVSSFLTRLKRSGLAYLTVSEPFVSDDEWSCSQYGAGMRVPEKLRNYMDLVDDPRGLLAHGFVCFIVDAVPLREPSVTMELRKFPEVYNARRFGGGAGADGTSIFLNSVALLNDTNSLDVKLAVNMFDTAMKKYYPNSKNYEISEPFARNNSIFLKIKGRRSAFEKLSNAEEAKRSEWWKVRAQLFISQTNFQDYVILFSLPETRVVRWGFDDFPNDEKFTKELTNDQRFLDFRDRLLGALTKEIDGSVTIP